MVTQDFVASFTWFLVNTDHRGAKHTPALAPAGSMSDLPEALEQAELPVTLTICDPDSESQQFIPEGIFCSAKISCDQNCKGSVSY